MYFYTYSRFMFQSGTILTRSNAMSMNVFTHGKNHSFQCNNVLSVVGKQTWRSFRSDCTDMSVETLIKNSCESVGEGPHWDEKTGTLLYVDIYENCIHRWHAETGKDEIYKFDKSVSFIVPRKSGGYMIGLGQTVSHFDWETKSLTVLHTVDQGKSTRFNDGKCDPAGRLWCGTMAFEKAKDSLSGKVKVPEGVGSLYCVDLDGSIRKQKEGISLSNGLAWSSDNKTMYFIDSIPRKVYAYDYDINTGNISNERVAIDFNEKAEFDQAVFPDGMSIDTDDKLWIACFFANKVVRFDPQTGQALSSIEVPARRVTSCCFGGKKYDEMFITCSKYLLPEEELKSTPLAGSVFKASDLGAKGKPAPIFLG